MRDVMVGLLEELCGTSEGTASVPLQKRHVEEVTYCIRHESLELGLRIPEGSERHDPR